MIILGLALFIFVFLWVFGFRWMFGRPIRIQTRRNRHYGVYRVGRSRRRL